MRLARPTPPDRSATIAAGVLQPVVQPAMPPATPPAALTAAPGLQERFRAFYERMHAPALDFAERFASRVEAEDAVQDAMTDVWLSWVRRGPEPFADRFFLAIVRHKVIDQRRTGRRMVSLEDAETPLDARALEAYARPTRRETRGDVLDLAVAALPPKRREVFVLAHEHEYTYKEVGTVLRVSEGTVKTHLRLATADVRDAFEAAGELPASPRSARLRAPSVTDAPTTSAAETERPRND